VKNRLNFIINLFFPILAVTLAQWIDLRLDFTQDQRYTLNSSTIEILETLDRPIKIEVFLSGKLPADYLRLLGEIKGLIQSMDAHSNKILIEYIDPHEGASNSSELINEMKQYGISPEYILSEKNQALEQIVIFPWAIVSDGNKTFRIPLITNKLGDSRQEKINRSIAQIEFKFFDAFFKLNRKQKKTIAVLTSHGTSENKKITDLMKDLQPYYKLASFDMKALENDPIKTLENLNMFELLVISNPKNAFSKEEKYILDQHLINGSKQLWMINPIAINHDSLLNAKGNAVASTFDLNMSNIFFKYGFRLEKNLVKDLYCAPIVLATGTQNKTQYLPIPWPYYPLVQPSNHPIGNGISNLWFKFPSTIDTLKSTAKKTVLVATSDFSQKVKVPINIQLNEASEKLIPSSFNQPNQTLGILISGNLLSAFKNRIKPFKLDTHVEKGESEMIIFSDGTLAENQLEKGNPLVLGYDKWTNNFYDNKVFLKNSIHYLMNDHDLLKIRNKSISIPIFDLESVSQKSNRWRITLLILPLLLLAGIGTIFYRHRKSRYSQ
jgi:gliding-associated putative ABC transporter substrate-binding component GldG